MAGKNLGVVSVGPSTPCLGGEKRFMGEKGKPLRKEGAHSAFCAGGRAPKSGTRGVKKGLRRRKIIVWSGAYSHVDSGEEETSQKKSA